nr:hypothetical protein [Tanacetum cinerariifolium]
MKEQESAEDEQEKEELRLCLNIVQDEERAINYETLAVKSLIVDWESQLLVSDLQEEDTSYSKITRADGSYRFYKFYSAMLEEFNTQVLLNLHILVMKRFKFVTLEGYDLILWGDLKTMIEPDKEDEKYPLTKEMLTRMLNLRLEADVESIMAFKLIRFIKAQLEEREVFGYILLVIKMLVMKKLDD